MTIAVLAVQGAFIEHEMALQKLGADCIELRKAEDLNQPYDGIVLPGGESTVQGKLLRELGMFDTIQSQIKNGMPVLATCAGMILLADKIDGDNLNISFSPYKAVNTSFVFSVLHSLRHKPHISWCLFSRRLQPQALRNQAPSDACSRHTCTDH